MLPYTVSSGHSKYMSWLPIYLSEMNSLPNSAPDVHKEFEAGNFAVHQTEGALNGLWADLALEQTYNKEGKTSLFKGNNPIRISTREVCKNTALHDSGL